MYLKLLSLPSFLVEPLNKLLWKWPNGKISFEKHNFFQLTCVFHQEKFYNPTADTKGQPN